MICLFKDVVTIIHFIGSATSKCLLPHILYSDIESHPKTACSCKKSARPSKAELTATKSNDIIMQPCARYASCKINIS